MYLSIKDYQSFLNKYKVCRITSQNPISFCKASVLHIRMLVLRYKGRSLCLGVFFQALSLLVLNDVLTPVATRSPGG